MATTKNTGATGKAPDKTVNKTTGKPKATMGNVSRFDDDGFGIRNIKKPGEDKKKTRKK